MIKYKNKIYRSARAYLVCLLSGANRNWQLYFCTLLLCSPVTSQIGSTWHSTTRTGLGWSGVSATSILRLYNPPPSSLYRIPPSPTHLITHTLTGGFRHSSVITVRKPYLTAFY